MIEPNMFGALRHTLSLSLLASALAAMPAQAQQAGEVRVMISGGFKAVYDVLVPQFEKKHGFRVVTIQGPSMGASPQSIPSRLANGEAADVVILADASLARLSEEGKIMASTRKDLAQSLIAMAVKEGAPVPDIASKSALAKALTKARSIAVSSSASGVYIGGQMYEKLGMQSQAKEKTRVIYNEPVAQVVARGEAELGFQQLSELKPVKGITIVGTLPAEVQKVTVFSAGVVKGAANEKGGSELIRFLSSSEAGPVLRDSGMEPVSK